MESGKKYLEIEAERLRRICLRLKGRHFRSLDMQDFDDCFQESVFKVCVKLDDGERIHSVKSYLCKTFLNEVRIFLAMRKRYTSLDNVIGIDQDSPFSQWAEEDIINAVEHICKKNSCEILRLSLIEGMKPKEIAEELGYSRIYVRQRLFKLKEKLREYLRIKYPKRF